MFPSGEVTTVDKEESVFLGRGYGFTVSKNNRSFPKIFLVSIWNTLKPPKEKIKPSICSTVLSS